MTLAFSGCGMGPAIAQDVENKISNLSFVKVSSSMVGISMESRYDD